MYGQSNLDILHRPKQDDCEYVRRRQHRIFRGYHGIDMQEEEDGKNGCINEKSQDDVFDVVYKYSTDTNVLRPPLWGFHSIPQKPTNKSEMGAEKVSMNIVVVGQVQSAKAVKTVAKATPATYWQSIGL
ncbi:hypothetical protein QTP88_015801 [Uroleucon formosanum]